MTFREEFDSLDQLVLRATIKFLNPNENVFCIHHRIKEYREISDSIILGAMVPGLSTFNLVKYASTRKYNTRLGKIIVNVTAGVMGLGMDAMKVAGYYGIYYLYTHLNY